LRLGDSALVEPGFPFGIDTHLHDDLSPPIPQAQTQVLLEFALQGLIACAIIHRRSCRQPRSSGAKMRLLGSSLLLLLHSAVRPGCAQPAANAPEPLSSPTEMWKLARSRATSSISHSGHLHPFCWCRRASCPSLRPGRYYLCSHPSVRSSRGGLFVGLSCWQ
jgi:hypothetical protein